MKYGRAFLLKWIVTAVVLFSIFSAFYGASLMNILIMSILVAGVAFFAGDLFILPRFGNLVAVVADFMLAALTIWIVSSLLIRVGTNTTIASFTAAGMLTVTEPFFHLYMLNRYFSSDETEDDNQYRVLHEPGLQTEFAQESEGQDVIRQHKKQTEEHNEAKKEER